MGEMTVVSEKMRKSKSINDDTTAMLMLNLKKNMIEKVTGPMIPAVSEFKEIIRRNATFRMAMNKMIQEVPWWFKYDHPDKFADIYIKNIDEMMLLLNTALVGKCICNKEKCPVDAIFKWCKTTPAGEEFFGNEIISDQVNNMLATCNN